MESHRGAVFITGNCDGANYDERMGCYPVSVFLWERAGTQKGIVNPKMSMYNENAGKIAEGWHSICILLQQSNENMSVEG